MFKDNPDTDIYGANVYNRYLQNRSLSRINQVVSQTATSMLSNSTRKVVGTNLWRYSDDLELVVDNAEHYYSAESLESVLVCTGVYNRETYEELSAKHHGHRDMITDAELKKAKYICEHVLDAVKLIFNKEQFH